MKKLASVLLGIFGGLISVLYFNQLIKFLFSFLLSEKTALFFDGILLRVNLISSEINFMFFVVLSILPLIASIMVIEVSSIVIKKSSNDLVRTALLIYQLLNTGYLILMIGLGIFQTIIKKGVSLNWMKFLSAGNFSYNQSLLIMFLIMMLLLVYLNFSTKRIKRNIPVIKE